MNRLALRFALVFALVPGSLFAPAIAHAQDAGPAADPPESAATTTSAPAPAGEKRDWEVELGGRVFVRDTYSRIDLGDDAVHAHTRDVNQARVFATYDRKRLRIAFEVELASAGGASIRDTFIRLRPVDPLRIQVGRFKVPMSFIGLESKWSLPSTERGILSELTSDDRDLPFAGSRADGLALELRPDVPLDPRFTVAAFQNPLASAATPLDPTEELTQDLYARASLEPAPGLEVAAGAALVGYPEELGVLDTYGEFPMGSLEVHADTEYLRVWAEGFLGQSFFHQPDGSVTGNFIAGRLLVAGRFKRLVDGLWRVEPFAGLSVLDPTNDVSGDRVSEVSGGVNLAFTKHWRVQVEVDQRVSQGTASPVADSTLVRIQLGAAFSEQVK